MASSILRKVRPPHGCPATVTPECSNWYSVICRQFIPVGAMPGKHRSEVRRGLKNCEVHRITARELSESGYETFVKAHSRYHKAKWSPPSKEEFRLRVARDDTFPKLRHQWGVFSQGRLIAFAQNQVFDRLEVNYSLIKFDPDYSQLYPVYALIYAMNEYYLNRERISYVNDGFCSVYHETQFQKFLMDKFNFIPAHTRLNVRYDGFLGALLWLVLALGQLPARSSSRLHALCELEQRRRARIMPSEVCWS